MNAAKRMEIREKMTLIRRSNLQRWMDEHQLMQIQVADRIGAGKSYVSLLFKRSFGENAARNIERMLGMPDGHLDREEDSPLFSEAWSQVGDLRSGVGGCVARTELVVGDAGALVKMVRSLPPVVIDRDVLAARGVQARATLVFVTVRGEAMAPYLGDGDQVLIDQAQTAVADGQAYALSYGRTLIVRRLRHALDGGLMLLSDNTHFATERLTPDDAARVQVLGRVVWRQG